MLVLSSIMGARSFVVAGILDFVGFDLDYVGFEFKSEDDDDDPKHSDWERERGRGRVNKF